ncbi:PilZ domain-containing protein [Geobacter sp. AOG1]|uniref:PilZ domain-containing protein n=1 Tax=Geobacter sp. AOG1 TaxID=1566346 RepID=UPI001CC487A4
MSKHRHHNRADYVKNCQLRLGNWYYLARIKNISSEGALVNFYAPPPDLHIGDSCEVSMSMDGDSLGEYSCEVVRVEASNIALKFTGVNKLKAVVH